VQIKSKLSSLENKMMFLCQDGRNKIETKSEQKIEVRTGNVKIVAFSHSKTATTISTIRPHR
jgi:uncharacterized protein YlaI